MASVSGDAGVQVPRSGGKIVLPRRNASTRTLYDRPTLRQQSPNWISRLVYYPTRAIASGAGKLISFAIFSDSSSSSSSDADSDSDGCTNKEIEDTDIGSSEDETIDESEALEMNNGSMNDQQCTVQKSETKHVIEQLVMQETFEREESDKLMNIIKSRVADPSTTAGAVDGRQTEFPNSGVRNDIDAPCIYSKAVTETRKWLEEKKLGSSSKSKLENEDNAGSPVNMAKSYMQTRPQWASPSVTPVEFRSPSPIGVQLLMDETPFSYRGCYLSSSKLKRRSPSAGSWNIQEEMRRVRAKATDDMLKNLSSSRTDWPTSSMDRKHGNKSLAADIFEASERDRTRRCANVVDASLNLDAGASSSCPVTQDVQDKGHGEDLPNPAASTSEHNLDIEGDQADKGTGVSTKSMGTRVGLDETLSSTKGFKSTEDRKTASKSGTNAVDAHRKGNDTTQPCSTTGGATQVVLALGATPDSVGNCPAPNEAAATDYTSKEVGGEIGCRLTSNCCPPSEPSLSASADAQPESRQPDEENNGLSSAHDTQIAHTTCIEEKCQLLSETLVEVPVVDESDFMVLTENDNSVTAGSRYGSSIQKGWLTDDLTLPISISCSPRKLSGYNRRGRGRGRGRGGGEGK